jgi:hypothetical protein
MAKSQDSSNVLLVEGAKSYPRALVALTEFRNLVTNTISGVVSDDLDTLASVLGCELSANDVRARRRPDRIDTVIKAPSLGIKIEKDEYGWRQYFQVTWWQGNLDAAASIRFLKERERVTSLFRDFKAKQAKLGLTGDIGCEADEVWLGRHLRAEEMADLEPTMRGLLADWIRLWSAVGGLKQAGKPGRKGAR